MKKILSFLVVIVMASTMMAKDYQHSIGMVAGLGLGAQYKTMVMDNFTILAEFGYFINPDGGTGFGYAGAVANGVFAWQGNLAEGDGIKLDLYAGGQVKMGYAGGGAGAQVGVVGFGGAVGIEANMKNAPIAFSFDFRPGYAFLFNDNWHGGDMFDYSLNLGVRYTF